MTPKEALKGIKIAIAEHLHKQTGVSVEKHFEYLQYDTEIIIIEQAINELEELKKYDTPLKSRVAIDKRGRLDFICLRCGRDVVMKENYCSHCGQKLDWGDGK